MNHVWNKKNCIHCGMLRATYHNLRMSGATAIQNMADKCARPMSERESLYRAVLDNATDDGVRLVFSDWLEEHEERDFAEFIRIQIELAKGWTPGRSASLVERQFELATRYRKEWLHGFKEGLFVPTSMNRVACQEKNFFHRGFVGAANINYPEHFQIITNHHPIVGVVLENRYNASWRGSEYEVNRWKKLTQHPRWHNIEEVLIHLPGSLTSNAELAKGKKKVFLQHDITTSREIRAAINFLVKHGTQAIGIYSLLEGVSSVDLMENLSHKIGFELLHEPWLPLS